MKYSAIKPETIVRSKIRVDKPSIFLLLPDINMEMKNIIYNTGISLVNCYGVISPFLTIRFFNQRVYSRRHARTLRQDLMDVEGAEKKLKVFHNLPITQQSFDQRQTQAAGFYFYDLSIYSFALRHLHQDISLKVLARHLFQKLQQSYSQIKTNFPTYNIDTFMFVNSEETPLYNMLNSIRTVMPVKDLQDIDFFDNYTFASNLDQIFPIMQKHRAQTQVITKNLGKLSGLVKRAPDTLDAGSQPEKDQTIDTTKSKTVDDFETQPDDIFTPDVKKTPGALSTVKQSDEETLGHVNVDKLRDVLSNYKIDDATIVANTKLAVDYYKQNTPEEEIQKDDLMDLVLKSIHYTIHGTGELQERYIHNPELLINKIKNMQAHRMKLEMPENDHIIDPRDIIDLEYTTGQFRQKMEYEKTIHDNIKQLFSTLENVSNHPIKVKKIDYEIQDNDRDRILHYKVTLKHATGENQQPYTVRLKVPGIVNDRYFKLRGNHYIQSNQQVLKPVTKTDKSEVRLLSNYAIMRVRTRNMRFNPSDVIQLLEYIRVKYSHIVQNSDYSSYIQFVDGSSVNLTGDTVYESQTAKIFYDDDGKLIDHKNNPINQGKNELIFEIFRDKIRNDNPEDQLTTGKRRIPYLEIYLSGIKMPLIIYLWSQEGLLKALNDLEINYRIINQNEALESNEIAVSLNNNQRVACTYENVRQELILNGILASRIKDIPSQIDEPDSIHDHIAETYGSRAISKINLMTQNQIDPVTKDLLEFEGMSTNLTQLVSTDMIDVLFEKQPDSLADLNIYRSRLSEVVLNLMYKQIKMAHNKYQTERETGDMSSHIYLDEDFIVNALLTDASSILQYAEPYNPVEEIMFSSRAVKSGRGIGGVPEQNQFKIQHRNIHESHYGNVGAVSTPEGTGVGLMQHHTLTPVISNEWGTYGGKDIMNQSGWNILTADEALILLQSSMDSDRATMARAHVNQATPVKNAEKPLVTTGAEFLLPQLSSKRFISTAKKPGRIKAIEPDRYVTIQYNDGNEESFDLTPRMSKTKRGSMIPLHMKCEKNVGDHIDKNEVIAHTGNFDQDGTYISGKNVFVSVMNYHGYSHEDAYTISRELADETTTDIIKEVYTVIPPDAKVISLVDEIGKQVNANDVLLEFTYDYNLDDYISTYASEIGTDADQSEIDDMIFGQSNETIKLLGSIDGEIVDFKIYMNNKKRVDNKIQKLHDELVKKDRQLIRKLEKGKDIKTSARDNISTDYMKVGGHKLRGGKEFEGAKIVYRIKYSKPLRDGDKIANRSALKGVISKILDEPPYGEFTPKIDIFVSPIGVFSRKNMSILKELYIGKIFYFLNKFVKERAQETDDMQSLINQILDVYRMISTDKVYQSVEKRLQNTSHEKLKQKFINETNSLFFMIEPFTNVTFEQIKQAADYLEIPLDEKVYLPELGEWTSTVVPVGVAYYQFLEHHADVYANVRASERYTGITGAPTKGKSKQGGQSIGNLDVNALITLEANDLLKEFFTIRSDDHRVKRQAYSSIMETGELVSLDDTRTGRGGTRQLFNIYMTSIGLETT